MTVTELRERMPLGEFARWLVFYRQRNEPAEARDPDWENMSREDITRAFNL